MTAESCLCGHDATAHTSGQCTAPYRHSVAIVHDYAGRLVHRCDCAEYRRHTS